MSETPSRGAGRGRAGAPPTTGHEWDGIREYDNPLPRWWLWVFYATIVWAIGYWIVMPAWPLISGYTRGVLGYSQRAAVAEQLREARAKQKPYLDRIRALPLAEIAKTPDLLEFAMAGGRSAFAVNCSPCHGSGAAGGPGFPNLNDDAWLWGGTLDDIAKTIRVGIRSTNPQTRFNQMPAFGRDRMLDAGQIDDLVNYVSSLSEHAHDAAKAARGAKLFALNCTACHGPKGQGNPALGAPNLTDAIWLYGGTPADIEQTIYTGRGGVMPAWEGKLDAATIKELAVYVHSLGGGK